MSDEEVLEDEALKQFQDAIVCSTCEYFDKAHPREPADDCCQLLYDKNGFWRSVKPQDFCSWHILKERL